MSMHIRRSLVYLTKNSSFLGKFHVSFSHFSTSSGDKSTTPSLPEVKRKHGISPQVASRVASALNHLKNPANPCSVISFLKENGFSETQLEKIIESRPVLLTASLEETIKPKFKIFKDMGISESQITKIISQEPWILKSSLENRIIPSLSVLNGLLGSNAEVAKLLITCNWFLSKDLEKTLVPNIKLLRSCGVPIEQIRKFIFSSPRFFLINPQTMRRLVEKVDKLGADRHSKMFIVALKAVGSMTEENWELKLQGFRNLGFSDENIIFMFKRAPQVFSSSVEKIKKLKDVLLATGKYNLSSILSSPMGLQASVEKRYKPRLLVLQILDSMNLIEEWPRFSVVYVYTDEKFYKKFVEPFSNKIGEVNIAKWKSVASSSKKRQDQVIR